MVYADSDYLKNFMFKYSFILAAIIIFTACNTHQPTTQDTSADSAKPAENSIMVPNTTCYASINGKDTIFLKLERFPNVVTGSLSYKLYEKDANKGDINGKLNGDTLVADYTFFSEGTQSVRQVAFLIKDSIATEGYADMEEQDKKMVFKNLNTIDFSKGVKLKQVECTVE